MLIFLLIVAIVPREVALRERCDVIEVNHVYCENEEGEVKPVFTQVIFRDWTPKTGKHEVVSWRMQKWFVVEDYERPEGLPAEIVTPGQRCKTAMLPTWNHARGCYEMRWVDGDALRILEVKTAVETWTLFDVEIAERETWPKERRRELRKAVR